MGTTVLLDILGSMFVGGILMVSLFRVQTTAVSNFYYYNQDFILQRQLLDIIEVMEADFKRLGYAQNPALIPNPSEAIRFADSTAIRFIGDLDNDGDLDSVRYYVSNVSSLNNTANPRDKILYRQLNAENPFILGTGVSMFYFDFYNALNNRIAFPIPSNETGEIRNIQMTLEIESSEAIEDEYARVYWRQVRLTSRNLQNR